jgi:hypothetical protein
MMEKGINDGLGIQVGWGSPEIQMPTWNSENETDEQQTLRQSEFVQRGFHYYYYYGSTTLCWALAAFTVS